MELGVYRKFLKLNYTIGRFSIDGVTICNSLEPPVRDLQDYNHDGDYMDEDEGKVYGNTAIPCGRYEVEVIWWRKHMRYIPVLKDVPGFTDIYIHSGVTVKDTMACILVGENKYKGSLTNSPYWSARITALIQDAINEGGKVFITVKQ
jgi:hypothetical protein